MRWTQKPTSGVASGRYGDLSPLIDCLPVLAAVVGAERPRRGNRDIHPLGIARILHDRVQAHAAGPRRPLGPRAMPAQARDISCHDLPPSVERNRAASSTPAYTVSGIIQRRLHMPHPLEFPGVLRAVIPLMRRQRLAVWRPKCHTRTCCSRPWACRPATVSSSGLLPGVIHVLPPSSDR